MGSVFLPASATWERGEHPLKVFHERGLGTKKYLQKVSNIELNLSKAENIFSVLSFHNIHNERHFVSTQSIFDDWLNELKPSGYWE